MASELHPSLGPSPVAKPVCCGCATTDDRAVLVPVSATNATTFMCASCAVLVWAAATGEHLRRCCEHFLEVDPFRVSDLPRVPQ